MSTLHAGEVGRFDSISTLVDNDILLIFSNGTLYLMTVADAKNYFLSNFNVRDISFADTPYQAVVNDDVINVDATGGNVTINMYALTEGEQIRFKKVDSSSNTVTIDGIASNIDGAGTLVVSSQYVAEHLIGGTSEWGRY